MKPLILFCVIVLILDSCIDPFNVGKLENDGVIVIDGLITDQPGPYQVILNHARNIYQQLDVVDKVRQASVILIDNGVQSETLQEASPGVYETKKAQGVVGHEYKIRITLVDGSVFESLPETLLPVGKMEKVWYEFDPEIRSLITIPPTVYPIPPSPGLNVYVDASVLPEQEGRVRWRTTGTWENLTFPGLRSYPSIDPRTGQVFEVFDPPKCFGFGFFPCTCCHCWMTNYDPEPLLSDPLFNKQDVRRQFISFIPADPNVFYNKYHIKVEQMSVSQTMYDFWDKVKTQKRKGSDLFQTPVPKATGNIKALNGKTQVVGCFGASAIRDTTFFITPEAIPFKLPYLRVIKESCLEGNPNATNVRPAFWN